MKAEEWNERIPVGLFYADKSRDELTEQISTQQPFYQTLPPAKQPIINKQNQNKIDLQDIFKELTI